MGNDFDNDEWGFGDDDNVDSMQGSSADESDSFESLWEDASEDEGDMWQNDTQWQQSQQNGDWTQQQQYQEQGYADSSSQQYNQMGNVQQQQYNQTGWNNQQDMNQQQQYSQPGMTQQQGINQQGMTQQQSQQQPTQTADDYWQQENAKNQAQLANPKKEFKPLSTAGVAVLAFVVIFIFLLILIGISKIKITKQSKPQAVTQQVAVAQQQTQQAGVDTLSLKSVPDSTSIDYSGEITSTTGIVIAKAKYLQGSQMVYAVIINAEILGNKQEFYYYCGFDVYNGVQVSDLVQVNYQKVSKKCFSINSVTK